MGDKSTIEPEAPSIPLAGFQQWMQQILLDPFQQMGDPRTSLPTELQDGTIEDVVRHSQNLPAREHLAIYQRSYLARLRNCMATQFSALEFALGEELFRAFADEYLVDNPSLSYNLIGLGSKFADYLESNRPDKDEEVKEDWPDFMIELARLEYAINIAFEEKANEDYELAKVECSDEDLALLPVCYLFKFKFPVRWFYSEFKNGMKPELPFERESHCILLRHQFELALYDIPPEHYEFLLLVNQGDSVSEAKRKFCMDRPREREQFESVWPTWKKRWIEARFFRRIS